MLGEQIDRAHQLGDPVAAWFFLEGSGNKAFDLSGNGNTGTITTATWVAGKYGSSLNFNGSTSKVNCGSGLSIDDIFVGGGTVVAYINPRTGGGGSQGRICQKGPSTDQVYLLQIVANNEWRFYHLRVTSAGGWDTPTNSVVFGKDHVVAVTYDNGSTANDPKIYIDGISQTLTQPINPSGVASSDAAHDLNIGGRDTDDRTFDGLISHILFYNRILSASEIALLYEKPFCMFKQSNVALMVEAAAPPPTGGQVITVIMSATPFFIIFTFVCLIRGKKS